MKLQGYGLEFCYGIDFATQNFANDDRFSKRLTVFTILMSFIRSNIGNDVNRFVIKKYTVLSVETRVMWSGIFSS